MTVVLQFPSNRVVPRDPSGGLLSAEIVIFPGVRVERRSFDVTKSNASVRKRRASQAAIDEDMA